MSALDSSDFSLLYRQLVILPQDRLVTSAKTKNSVVQKSKEPKEVEPQITISTKVDEPIVAYDHNKSTSFAIITLPNLKSIYLKEGSKFEKIIHALNIDNCAKHLYSDWGEELDLANIRAIWTIGLSADEEKLIKAKSTTNILCSPDIEQLASNEEKRAMFEPLKVFVASNREVIDTL